MIAKPTLMLFHLLPLHRPCIMVLDSLGVKRTAIVKRIRELVV